MQGENSLWFCKCLINLNIPNAHIRLWLNKSLCHVIYRDQEKQPSSDICFGIILQLGHKHVMTKLKI